MRKIRIFRNFCYCKEKTTGYARGHKKGYAYAQKKPSNYIPATIKWL